MKIGILSRKASLYSTNRLVEAAEEREVPDEIRSGDDICICFYRPWYNNRALSLTPDPYSL